MRIFVVVLCLMIAGCVNHEYSKWEMDNSQVCWNLGGTFDRNPYGTSIRCVRGNEVLFIKEYKGTIK